MQSLHNLKYFASNYALVDASCHLETLMRHRLREAGPQPAMDYALSLGNTADDVHSIVVNYTVVDSYPYTVPTRADEIVAERISFKHICCETKWHVAPLQIPIGCSHDANSGP